MKKNQLLIKIIFNKNQIQIIKLKNSVIKYLEIMKFIKIMKIIINNTIKKKFIKEENRKNKCQKLKKIIQK